MNVYRTVCLGFRSMHKWFDDALAFVSNRLFPLLFCFSLLLSFLLFYVAFFIGLHASSFIAYSLFLYPSRLIASFRMILSVSRYILAAFHMVFDDFSPYTYTVQRTRCTLYIFHIDCNT